MQRPLPWLLAALAVLAALSGFGAALVPLRRSLQRGAPPAWWFGYLRDAVNALAVLALWTVFWWAGYPGPEALLLGFALAFCAYALEALFGALSSPAPAFVLSVLPTAVAAMVLLRLRPALHAQLARLLHSIGGG